MTFRRTLRLFTMLLAAFAAPGMAAALEIKEGDFTTKDGIKIHYYDGGEGTTVILVHGLTSSAANNWIGPGVFEDLARNHRVVALDCRNHGKSDKPQPGTPGRSSDFVELMDHLKIAKAHIHGYSMGGAIVGELLVMIPDRLITAGFGGAGIFDGGGRAARPAADAAADGTKSNEANTTGATAAPSRGALSRIDFNQPGIPRPGGPPGIDLKKVAHIPMLVINGEQDNPEPKSARISREVTDYKVVVVPGKTHMTTVRDPLFIKSTHEFIDAHDPK